MTRKLRAVPCEPCPWSHAREGRCAEIVSDYHDGWSATARCHRCGKWMVKGSYEDEDSTND